jgi:hypothetical protein
MCFLTHNRSCSIVNALLKGRHFGSYAASLMVKVIEWRVLLPKNFEEGKSREQSGTFLLV